MDLDKRFFKKLHRQLKSMNVWIILAVAIISGIVCALSLRNNNITALKLRDQVIQADKDNGDVEKALRELRAYIYAHMNTNLASGKNAIKPPIQLKYRYERLVKAEQDKLSVENAQIYTAAQAECEKKFPKGLSGSGRIPCITEYVSVQGIKQKPIDSSLYKFDFVSPSWSPDLAGWSLVICTLAFTLFLVRYGLDRWAQAELRDL